MDTISYIALEHAVDCGSYDCLMHCCDDAQALRTIWLAARRFSEDDFVNTLGKLLCCRRDVIGLPTGDPWAGTDHCLRGAQQWVRENSQAFDALQIAVEFLQGLVPPGWPGWVVDSISLGLEILEDAAFKPDGGLISEVHEMTVCKMAKAMRYAFDLAATSSNETIRNVARRLGDALPLASIVGACCRDFSDADLGIPPQITIQTPGTDTAL